MTSLINHIFVRNICKTLLQESLLILTGDVLVDENLIRICDIIDNLTPTGNQ